MRLDMTATQLATLRAQVERLPHAWQRDAVLPAFDVADRYFEDIDRIAGERYREDRAAEERTKATAAVVAGLIAVRDEVRRASAAERQDAVDAWDGERLTRARDGRRLSDVVDVSALETADDARVVRGLVETADAFDLGAEARAVALRAVRPKAADEQRRGRLNGPWFGALCWLSESARSPRDRHEIAQRVDAECEAAARFVDRIAAVVGVGQQLARETARVAAPVPDDVKSTFTVGRFWELNPSFRR